MLAMDIQCTLYSTVQLTCQYHCRREIWATLLCVTYNELLTITCWNLQIRWNLSSNVQIRYNCWAPSTRLLMLQCLFSGCGLHNYALTSVTWTSVMLWNAICPQRCSSVSALVLLFSFHTEASSQCMPAPTKQRRRARSVKQKLEEVESEVPAECSQCLATVRERGKQSETKRQQ